MRLHGAATPDRAAAFERSVVRRGAHPSALLEEGNALCVEGYGELAAQLGLEAQLSDAVAALRRLPDLLGEARVISPGDVCPDNNAVVGDRLVLLDLEGAQLLHPAWDVAYLTAPWPTCWCAWTMPADVVAAAVDRYVAATGAGPGFRDDLADHAGVVGDQYRLAAPASDAARGGSRPEAGSAPNGGRWCSTRWRAPRPRRRPSRWRPFLRSPRCCTRRWRSAGAR